MQQFHHQLSVQTPGRGLHPIGALVAARLAESRLADGLATLFIRHSSASLLVQESASADARADLEAYFARLAPESSLYAHADEGPDDMPAHLRAALTATSLSIPVMAGRLALGRWQEIYLFEHRAAPHRRAVAIHLLGTVAP